jgi:hypothetical protein
MVKIMWWGVDPDRRPVVGEDGDVRIGGAQNQGSGLEYPRMKDG